MLRFLLVTFSGSKYLVEFTTFIAVPDFSFYNVHIENNYLLRFAI